MNTGEMIKQARQKAILKTKDLARSAKVNPTYITQIERNNKLPSFTVLKKIVECKELKLDPTKAHDIFVQYLKDKEGPEIAQYITETASTICLKAHGYIKAPKKKRKSS